MSVRQELKKRRTWLSGKGDWEARTRDQMAETLARPDGDETALLVSGIASGLASVLGVRGELAVVDGSYDGWIDVQRSFQLWKLRIEIETSLCAHGAPALRSVGLEPSGRLIALASCYAIALRRSADEAWLQQVMTTMHKDTRVVRPKWWADHSVPSFAARLLGLGVVASVKSPHREVLEQGNDDRQLSRALAAVCDYHVEHMTIGNQGHEFADGPFGLIPFEVLAVLALRQRAGRSAPALSHELLAGPIAARWAEVDVGEVDDPLLASLAGKAGQSLGPVPAEPQR